MDQKASTTSSNRGPTIGPKIRQVGFAIQFQPQPSLNPTNHHHNHRHNLSNTSSVLSLVMIPTPPPLLHPLAETSSSLPVPIAAARRVHDGGDSVASSESDDAELSEEWMMRSSSGKYSLGFDMSGVNSPVAAPNDDHHEVDFTTFPDGHGEQISEAQLSLKDVKSASNPFKEKTSKAERRALQEAQRAVKAAKKAEASGTKSLITEKPAKVTKQRPPKKDARSAVSSVPVSEIKSGDHPVEKDKKKDIPAPRMQYDDKSRVEKAKKRSVVKQTEVKNRVELFQHLPQYEYGNQLSDLESKIFELDLVHPAVYKVGLQYLAGDISGSNARCIAMLCAFKEAIKDYHTPPEKTLTRDLTARISTYISYVNGCRPLSISMGNAIRYLKNRVAKLPLNLTESDALSALCSAIDQYINEKIIIADRVIVHHAFAKIRDGDVLLTYGCSSVVEMVLLYAHEVGIQFRVIIVDSRPKLEGQGLLRRLVTKGLRCTYTHINAVSYVMHEVTKVLLGAASIFSNGTVYSRIGTASVAMVAHSFRVPVLVCCEAYKFHERVQLDSICANELGDPDAISTVPLKKNLNCLDNWTNNKNLQLLNLLYDLTPSDYVSLIITDYGMVPPTSVPVIVREYGREHLF